MCWQKQREFLGLDHLLRKALDLLSAVLKATRVEAASTKRKQDKEQEGGSQLPAGKRPAHEPFLQLRAVDNSVLALQVFQHNGCCL